MKKRIIKKAKRVLGRTAIDVDELRVKIFYDAPKGLNDIQLCKFLGISEATFYNLKRNNLEFLEAIKFYKKIAAVEVLASFKKLAAGFTATESKSVLQKDEKGKYKMVVTEITEKHFPPNPTAGIFFLKNQMSEHFKDKIEHEIDLSKNTLDHITFVIKGKDE